MKEQTIESVQNKKVQSVDLEELAETAPGQPVVVGNQLELIKDVKVSIQACLGETEISIGELFDLKRDSVLKLDMPTHTPIDLVLDQKVVARGNLVVVDDSFGVQINEVVGIGT